MRKVLLTSLLALGVTWGGSPAIGAPPAGKGGGPACADIVSLGGSYSVAESSGHLPTEAGPSIVAPNLGLAAPSCTGRGITYTVIVLDDDSPGAPVVAEQSVRGEDTKTVPDLETVLDLDDMVIDEAAGDTHVCVYAQTSAGNHIFDRLPAEGCVLLNERFARLEGGWSP